MPTLEDIQNDLSGTPLSKAATSGAGSMAANVSTQEVAKEESIPVTEFEYEKEYPIDAVIRPKPIKKSVASTSAILSWGGGGHYTSGLPKVMPESWMMEETARENVAEKDKPLDFNTEKLKIVSGSLKDIPTTIRIGGYETQLSPTEQELIVAARTKHKNAGNVPPELIDEFNEWFETSFDIAKSRQPEVAMPFEKDVVVATEIGQNLQTLRESGDTFNPDLSKTSLILLDSPEFHAYTQATKLDGMLPQIGYTNSKGREILRDNWTMGDVVPEAIRGIGTTTEGLIDLGQLLTRYSAGYAKAKVKSMKLGKDFLPVYDGTLFRIEMDKVHANMAKDMQAWKASVSAALPAIDDQTTRVNNLITDKSCDFYFIMWSRGIDRRFERILNYDLSERWVNIIPHPDNSKKDKIKNDINKFIFSNLVTDKSSFLNTFVYMISLQELFKLYNKKYLFSFANDDFLDFYLKYKNKFNIKVKPYNWEHSKETDFTSLIKRLNFDYIIEKPFSNFIDSDDLNRHPNENECKMFMEYLIEICDEMELL